MKNNTQESSCDGTDDTDDTEVELAPRRRVRKKTQPYTHCRDAIRDVILITILVLILISTATDDQTQTSTAFYTRILNLTNYLYQTHKFTNNATFELEY